MTISERILIVGGDSFVGKGLADFLSAKNHTIIQTTRRRDTVGGNRHFVDMAAPQEAILPIASVAIICAAEARVAFCEEHREESRRINVDGALTLARRLHRSGAHVIFLSSDKVFDGLRPMRRFDEAPVPKTEYGRQKAMAEAQILALGSGISVVRMAKVVSPKLDLLQSWTAALKAGRVVTPFKDLQLAPVSVDTVGGIIDGIIGKHIDGIFHASSSEDKSYVALANALVKSLGSDISLIRPVVSSTILPVSVPHCPNTTLDMSREAKLFGIKQIGFRQTIDPLMRRFVADNGTDAGSGKSKGRRKVRA